MIFTGVALALGACSHHTYVPKDSRDESRGSTKVVYGYPNTPRSETNNSISVKMPEIGGGTQSVNFLPNATAFRMSGD